MTKKSDIICERCGRNGDQVGFYETAMMKLASAWSSKRDIFPVICSDCFQGIIQSTKPCATSGENK